ncbi:hypothetical protein, partial [uncultured Rhodoblastus sp.]|uniref:hypothetical protein n=1 Tax=uncultured Rhodoblastus sp. TaxID=543037 RepID=UPI0025E86E3C
MRYVTVFNLFLRMEGFAVTKTNYNLASNSTTAQISSYLNADDNINISATLNNISAMLTIGSDANYPSIVLLSGGAISGGVIKDYGSGFQASGGTLSGVTYEGALDLTPSSSSVTIVGGLTATGANGSGPGVINVGQYSSLTFDDT